MAVAKVICSACGGSISGRDEHCPHCGEKIEGTVAEVSPAPALAPARTPEVSGRCEVCGHSNKSVGNFCELCGARLPLQIEEGGRRDRDQQQGTHAGPRTPKSKRKAPARRYEPWQLVAGAAIIVLAGYFVYTETGRDHGERVTTPVSSPPSRPAVSPEEIDRLQEVVDSNPGDQASQLRLANLLHDSGLYSRAVETYRKYLSVRPQDTNARVDLGICYFELARLDSAGSQRLLGLAIAEMEKAARDSARHQPAAFNLGIVNLYAGNTQESNRWFRRAIELNGDSDLGIRAKRLLEQHSFQSPSTN